MGEEAPRGNTEALTWETSQRVAQVMWGAIRESFTEQEILAFCIHYLGAQAIGDFAETPEYVEPVKHLSAWYHFILTSIEEGIADGRIGQGDQEGTSSAAGEGESEESRRAAEARGIIAVPDTVTREGTRRIITPREFNEST